MSEVIFGKGQFGKAPLTVHCWNADRSMLALSTETGKVNIYKVEGTQTTLMHTLSDHTGRVTGIDWCPKTNQLATCSADRNAFVWVFQDGEWRPTLVLLRVHRACTCIHWSPEGNKFAVGTGSRIIAVCYFDVANNFWVAKHVKKPIKSTITCLDWHPNNMLLVAGGTDFKVRVFSAFIGELDQKPSEPTNWGPMKSFGTVLAEYDADGWVHSVALNHHGDRAVAVSHGSMITVCSLASGAVKTPWEKFPFKAVAWLSESRVVCAGFDFIPEVFNVAPDGSVSHAGTLDELKSVAKTGQASARNIFMQRDWRGTSGESGDSAGEAGDASIKSVHKNTIMHIHNYQGQHKASVEKISTCGLDGQIVLWDVKSLSASFAQLKI